MPGVADVVDATIPAAAQLALGAVFLWAAASKVLAVNQLRDTLEQLGVDTALARAGAPLVVAAEFAAGAGLIVVPGSWTPRGLVVVLASAFALAGLFAVRTGRRVNCHCFGGTANRLLGWRQVWQWPLWVGLAAIAHWRPADWAWRDGVAILAFVLVALTLMRLPGQLRLMRRLQGDRIALTPTYRGQPDEGEVTE